LFETVLDKTISQNTAGKVVGLQGYKEFGVLARFDGGSVNANKEVDFEIGHNQITVVRKSETQCTGWANFAKVYLVYAPNVDWQFTTHRQIKNQITIYAGH